MENRAIRVGRERILEVAENLFTEHGFSAVSIRDIAQRCEVTNAALYYHFPSKAALFSEVMEQHAERLNARMRKAGMIPGAYRERAVAMLSEYARMAADRRPQFMLFRGEADGFDKTHSLTQVSNLFHAMLFPLEDLLHEAIQHGELRPLPEGISPAALLVGMLHGQIQHNRICKGERIGVQEARLVVDIFWIGLEV